MFYSCQFDRFDSISHPPPTLILSLSSLSLNLQCECIVTLWNLSIDFHFVFPCMTLTFMELLCIFGRLSERDRMEKNESSEGFIRDV